MFSLLTADVKALEDFTRSAGVRCSVSDGRTT